ncbi:MAG: bacillithiol biosynthesis deacetylase BshB1 [Actinomycetota bacterium]
MTNGMDILAIAAHPDDAEVGCAGVLIQAADAGLRVAVADLTSGELATRGAPDVRAAERARASQVMRLSERIDIGLPDGRLGTDPGHRDAVIALIREVRPAVVLAPYPEDRHPDHAAAGRLASEGSFLAGVAKVAAGAPHRPERVYHYMVHHPFTPSFVVDVSAVWERKWAAVTAYESQFGETLDAPTDLAEGRFLRMVEARARYHGAMIGTDRGEPFHSPGPVPLGFLPGFHDLGPGADGGYRMFH